MILFGDRQPGTFLNLRFGKVEALFALPPVLLFLTLIVLEFLGVSLQWHFDGGPAIIFFCVMAVVIFFLARFCLVFPIAVIERRFDFARAWALSHGNVWRMIAVWFVVTTPPLVIVAALLWLLLTGLTSLLEFVLLSFPTSIVIGALCVGMLSYSYKALAGLRPDEVVKSTIARYDLRSGEAQSRNRRRISSSRVSSPAPCHVPFRTRQCSQLLAFGCPSAVTPSAIGVNIRCSSGVSLRSIVTHQPGLSVLRMADAIAMFPRAVAMGGVPAGEGSERNCHGAVWSRGEASGFIENLSAVMAALVAAIHVLFSWWRRPKTWMAGTSPAMTKC